MKIERKYMAHYLNATFAADDGTASYVRLGKDLEEYSPELSANVEKKTNILGNETVSIDSYQKQGEVSPYYAEKGDPLFEKLQSIIYCWNPCRIRTSTARWKRGNGSWTAASCFFPKRLGSISGAFGARNSRTETVLLPIRPC